MVKLTKSEKEEIVSLSSKFVQIHREVTDVEKAIEKMKEKAKNLMDNLEDCRERERVFTQRMLEKYGEGHLDPMNLAWKKEEIVYENKN